MDPILKDGVSKCLSITNSSTINKFRNYKENKREYKNIKIKLIKKYISTIKII